MDLGFAADPAGGTFLRRQLARHPVHLCRGLHLSGDPPGLCSLLMQSSSGGLFEDERLALRVTAGPASRAHLTTAASTVVHSMTTGRAEQHCELDVAEDALLEYLPAPLILFPGSRLRSVVRARVHERATLIVGESFLAHDPQGDGRPFGWLAGELTVTDQDGRLLVRDAFRADGAAGTQSGGATGAATAHPAPLVQGSLLVVRRDGLAALLADIRERCTDPAVYLGASLLPNDAGIGLRAQSPDPVALRRALQAAWSVARRHVTGHAPSTRRH